MIRHPHLVPLAVLVAILVQTAARDCVPVSPAPTPGKDRESATGALSAVLHDGTPIKLRLLNTLDSHKASDGDEIQLDIVNDIVVRGVTVLRRGTAATGVVIQAKSSKTMGRAGKLSFTINDIKLGNGNKVPVRAFNRSSGENRTGDMVAAMIEMPIVAAPFFLLIHGTNTTFPRGTEITAFVNGDRSVDLASFDTHPDRSK